MKQFFQTDPDTRQYCRALSPTTYQFTDIVPFHSKSASPNRNYYAVAAETIDLSAYTIRQLEQAVEPYYCSLRGLSRKSCRSSRNVSLKTSKPQNLFPPLLIIPVPSPTSASGFPVRNLSPAFPKQCSNLSPIPPPHLKGDDSMSYFTRYTLDVFRDDTPAFIPEPTRCAIQHELQTLYADASPCLIPFDPSAYFYDDENDILTFDPENECPFDVANDMIKLSLSFPSLTFRITSKGECDDDYWRQYFVNGKTCTCPGKIEITYAPYNPRNLEAPY